MSIKWLQVTFGPLRVPPAPEPRRYVQQAQYEVSVHEIQGRDSEI